MMKTIATGLLMIALVSAGCSDPQTESGNNQAPPMAPPAVGESSAIRATQPAAVPSGPADFSGTWVLNTDRGENLGMMKAVKETIVATQTDAQIVFDMTDVFAGMTTTRSITYDLNGATMQNKAAMGAPSETVTRWEDDKLVTTWTEEGAIAGTETVRTETRWLSEDGSVLSVSMSRADNPPMIFVYEKAE